MENLDQIWVILDKGGVIAALGLIIVAIWKRVLVPGWVYDWCMQRADTLDKQANDRAARIEAKLDARGTPNERP